MTNSEKMDTLNLVEKATFLHDFYVNHTYITIADFQNWLSEEYMEEYTRPLNERDKKIIAEMKIVEKLKKEEGCKLLDCNVVTNNINLRIEIIDLKREMREQEKIIELMAKEINDGMFFNSTEEVKEYFKKKAKGEK